MRMHNAVESFGELRYEIPPPSEHNFFHTDPLTGCFSSGEKPFTLP